MAFPLAYLVAFLFQKFIVSKFAERFAFRFLVKPTSKSWKIIISITCCTILYVLYNNYIYNVYKDGKYRLEGGHRNDMNIKYRLLCKRLIEERKRVGVIQYYNVLFIMELLSDKDIWSLEQWVNGINNIYMKDIHNWCRMHFVKYHTVFVYRKEYPVKANIWNGYSYIRWRMERMMNLE